MRFTTLAAAGMLAVFPLGTAICLGQSESARAVDATDLWGLWREGFEKYEAAEEAAKSASRHEEAMKLYLEARKLFENIHRQNPQWNKEVIGYRIALCTRRINELDKPRRDAVAQAKKQKIELEKSLEAERTRLREELRKARLEILELKNRADKNARSAEQVNSLLSEKNSLEARLASAAVQIDTLKRKIVKAERSEVLNRKLLLEKARVEELKKQIRTVTERLAASRLEKARADAQTAEAELKLKKSEARVRELQAALEPLERITLENNTFRTEIAKSEKEIKRLQSELEKTMRTAGDLRNEIARIRSGKEVLPSVRKLEEDLSVARKDGNYLRTQIAAVNDELKKLKDSSQKKSEERRQLALELTRTISDRELLRKENSNLKQQLKNMEGTAADTAKIISALKAERDTLHRELTALAAKQEQLRKAAEKSDSQLEELTKLRARCQQVEKANISLKNELDAHKKDLAALNDSKKVEVSNVLKNSQKELKTVRDENARLTAETEKLKAESSEFAKLRAKYGELSVRVSSLTAQQSAAEKIRANNDRLSVEAAQLRARTLELTNSLNEKQQETNRILKQVDALKKELSAAKNSVASAEKLLAAERSKKAVVQPSPEIQQLKQQLNEQKNQCALLEKKLAAAPKADDAETKRLKKQIAEITAQRSALEKQIADVKARSVVQPKTEDRSENIYLKKQVDEARARSAELEKKLTASEAKLVSSAKTAKAEMEKLEQTNSELNKKITELRRNTDQATQAEIRKLSAAVTELIEGKTQYENAIRSLTKLRDSLTAQNETLTQNLKLARQEIQLLKEQLSKASLKSESDRKHNELLDKLGKAESRNAALLAEQKQLQDRIAKLNGSLENTKRELGDANKTAVRYREELKRWTDDPEKIKDGIIKRKDEAISGLIKEGEELRKELSTLKAELVMSRDEIRRIRSLSIAVAQKYQRVRAEVQRLKQQNGTLGIKAADPTGKAVVEKPITTQLVKVDTAKYKEAMTAAQKAEKSGDVSGAMMNYWRAADADPNSAEAYAGLARIYLKRGEKASAAKAYAKAVELGYPKNPVIESDLKK